MSKFYGFRSCTNCEIACTPSNFVDYQKKRYCTACWIQNQNPEHPELKLIREKVVNDAEQWKCIKWSREEGPLPNGPISHKN
ncbi:MAG: hypothetical protein NLN64_00585 [Candidatus Thalassarchaeaceae archaeon]|nr:hypothetical protein [Candidatus Thalassarchaeaceae archaeon]